ncbi:MAG: transposase, partial [Candidatus Bathyarchaeota archaeon]|nr:transposase [Candidatus Termiticorpusculum sp.]
NKQKQRSEQKRNYIGTITNGTFTPNKKHQLQQQLNNQQQKQTTNNNDQNPTKTPKRLFTGTTYLLDKITEKLGINTDLKQCFPTIHKEILSLTYYLTLEPTSPIYRFKKWANTHEHPNGKDIPSQRSSELLSMITEDAKMNFFQKQANRRIETEYLFYDSTSISSYSEQLKQAKYGKNKDGDNLAQINLALLLGQNSGLPVYYRKLPGNITDVMTIQNLLAGIKYFDLKKLKLVLDRGFYSAFNVNALFRANYEFVIGAKISLKFIQKQLEGVRAGFNRRENYNAATGLFIKSQVMDWPYEETTVGGDGKKVVVVGEVRRVFVHLYFNDQLAVDERLRFNKLLDVLEEELLSGKRKVEHEKSYERYFDVVLSSNGGVGVLVRPKQSAIDLACRDFGFFVLLSNVVVDPVLALCVYRSRDLIEKAFCDLKDRLNMRRTSVSSEENLEGKLFLQFVGLIYLSFVKGAMDRAGLFKSYTMQELFDELDVIEMFQLPGEAAYFGEITEKQRDLYTALGVEPPS